MGTYLRKDAKAELIRHFRKEGYASYARLLQYFDVCLSDEPSPLAYVVPDEGIIVVYKDLLITQVSTILRHEILHEFLNHGARGEAVDATRIGNHMLMNIAADYEISNVGYTNKDKDIIRNLCVDGKCTRALVTEDDHPDWVDLTFEEMYNKLLDEIPIEDLNNSKCSNEDITGSNTGSKKVNAPNNDSPENENEEDSDSSSSTTGSSIENSDEEGGGKGEETSEQREADTDAIKELMNSSEFKSELFDETAKSKREEADLYNREFKRRSGLHKFKLNLNKFIKNTITEAEEEHESYNRINPSYEDSEFILKYRQNSDYSKRVPKINVYWDVSGSMDDPVKQKGAQEAIDTLCDYVRTGDIVIDVYYFASKVSSHKGSAGMGTLGTPILKHIIATKPDNVVIITDEGIEDCEFVVTVPGAVWFLFYTRKSENIEEHVKGKSQTCSYLIKRSYKTGEYY